jgi:hypothetical protein
MEMASALGEALGAGCVAGALDDSTMVGFGGCGLSFLRD